MHQSTTPSLSQSIWPRSSSRQFLTLPIVETLLPVTFGYFLSSESVVHCSQRRLLRRGLEFPVCTINKSSHTIKVRKLIVCSSYIQDTRWESLTPLQRCSQCILQPQLIEQSITRALPSDFLVLYSGHSLGESYSFAEKQSVYCTTPTDWAKHHSSFTLRLFRVIFRTLVGRVLLLCSRQICIKLQNYATIVQIMLFFLYKDKSFKKFFWNINWTELMELTLKPERDLLYIREQTLSKGFTPLTVSWYCILRELRSHIYEQIHQQSIF